MRIKSSINTLLSLLLSIIALSANAQNGVNSPYSRFGYGLLNDNTTSMQRGMGGIGYGMNSGRQINVMNPASYAAIDSLTMLFDMGAHFTYMRSNEGALSESKLNGGLDYLTMSFPISRRIGASIGLLPFASTGYAFGDSIKNATTSHQGSGNINQLYVGAAINPFANLYIGFNFGYIFGNTTNDIYATTITGSTSLFQRFISVNDWRLDVGLQYPIRINKNNRVTLGVTYSPRRDLHGETYGLYYDATLDSKADTVGYSKLNGAYQLAESFGGGINYQWNDRLMIEADFTYQPWRDAKYQGIENFESNEFDNRWRVAIGGQYTPDPRGSYVKRFCYRAGMYYDHDYIVVRGNNIREFGATVGMGIPIAGYKTMINVAVQYKHRQAHPVAMIKENYLNITLGINFNEMWFRKSKIY